MERQSKASRLQRHLRKHAEVVVVASVLDAEKRMRSLESRGRGSLGGSIPDLILVERQRGGEKSRSAPVVGWGKDTGRRCWRDWEGMLGVSV